MKTIGNLLKESRIHKNLSLYELERTTKIKKTYISAIEEENWDKLPPFPTILGFVKSLSYLLGINENTAIATLKRDYPPKKLRISPKPDVESKLIISPKLTFFFGVMAVVLILSTYLISQYIHFVSPPNLEVTSPKEGQVVMGKSLNVFGSTDSDAKILINNQPVLVTDGKFSINLDIVPETKEIAIQASSRSGKITEVRRKIEVR